MALICCLKGGEGGGLESAHKASQNVFVMEHSVHKTMNQCSAEQLIQQQLPPAHTLAVKIANLLS